MRRRPADQSVTAARAQRFLTPIDVIGDAEREARSRSTRHEAGGLIRFASNRSARWASIVKQQPISIADLDRRKVGTTW